MSHLRAHRIIDRVLASPLALLLLVVLVGLIGNAVWGIYQKEQITQDKTNQIQSEVTELREREVFLNSEIEALRTSEGQGRALREQFGVARPGEQVIVLVDDPNAPVQDVVDKSFWDTVKNFFGVE